MNCGLSCEEGTSRHKTLVTNPITEADLEVAVTKDLLVGVKDTEGEEVDSCRLCVGLKVPGKLVHI